MKQEKFTKIWKEKEIEELSQQFGIRAGCRLHDKAQDFHFPEMSFLAEGYSPPGGYVKDFCVVMTDGRLHVFHIDGRPGEVCWITGNEISFGHASTADYQRWIRHPMPLAVGERSWESEHIWAPYVYERDDLYYMFYMGGGYGETFISYATSSDLQHWTRWEQGPIRSAIGRDPFVFDCDDEAVLLFTGLGGARILGCVSRDMASWKPIPDVIRIPNGASAESCSLHSLDGNYVLWFNDYQAELTGFRAAYAISDHPFQFNADEIHEFRFLCDTPGATASPELRVKRIVPLSVELIARGEKVWFVAYFRWQVDRNRLFFGVLDWSMEPATLIEINNEEHLRRILTQVEFGNRPNKSIHQTS